MRISHFVAALIGIVAMHVWIWLADTQPPTWQSRWLIELSGGAVLAFAWEFVIRLSPFLKRALTGQRRH